MSKFKTQKIINSLKDDERMLQEIKQFMTDRINRGQTIFGSYVSWAHFNSLEWSSVYGNLRNKNLNHSALDAFMEGVYLQ